MPDNTMVHHGDSVTDMLIYIFLIFVQLHAGAPSNINDYMYPHLSKALKSNL
jgi:hypothetical protein